ncbi:hypothetical protein CHLRE_03g209953v5 [Chlamydomonas reinhardtii]|uniref:AP2/ERF domain-containing protein n=1 Tax=Chlamydomonas reinhardtii TaxID=3055 RepID=A0A2K3DZW4_CHLRE|nr:uncharacterized protein CHLRE_03g209953v5 [Chlamydomonas reinhardtii]PNW86061.1 hypothetical protein CHLRE_03g209953v5 [Chlamydomonas reinhardtii]
MEALAALSGGHGHAPAAGVLSRRKLPSETAQQGQPPLHPLGFRGVCYNRMTRRWQAGIAAHGRAISLGAFDAEEDAARIYDKAALRIRGLKATVNFPVRDYLLPDGALALDLQVEALLLEAFLSRAVPADAATAAAVGDVVRQCLGRINGADPADLQEAAEALGPGYMRLMGLIADAAELLAASAATGVGAPGGGGGAAAAGGATGGAGVVSHGSGEAGAGAGTGAGVGITGNGDAVGARSGLGREAGGPSVSTDGSQRADAAAAASLSAGGGVEGLRGAASCQGPVGAGGPCVGVAPDGGLRRDKPGHSPSPSAAEGAVGGTTVAARRAGPPEAAAAPDGAGAQLPPIPPIATPPYLPPNFMQNMCQLLATHTRATESDQQRQRGKDAPAAAAPPPPAVVVAVRQLEEFGFPLPLLMQGADHLASAGIVSPQHFKMLQAAVGGGAAAAGAKRKQPEDEAAEALPHKDHSGDVDGQATKRRELERVGEPAPAAPAASGRTRSPSVPPAGAGLRLDPSSAVVMAAATVAAGAAGGVPLAAMPTAPTEQAAVMTAIENAAAAVAAMPPVGPVPPALALAGSGLIGGGGGPPLKHIGLGRRLFQAIQGQLPPGCELESLMPPKCGFVGVLYAAPPSCSASGNQAGAGLWDGAAVRDLGLYSSDRDARQAVNSAARLLATTLAAATGGGGSGVGAAGSAGPGAGDAGAGRGAMAPPAMRGAGAGARGGGGLASINSASLFRSSGNSSMSAGGTGAVAPAPATAPPAGARHGGRPLEPAPSAGGLSTLRSGPSFSGPMRAHAAAGAVTAGGRLPAAGSLAAAGSTGRRDGPLRQTPAPPPLLRSEMSAGGHQGPYLVGGPDVADDGSVNLLCQILVPQAEPLTSDDLNNVIARSLTPAALQSLLGNNVTAAAAAAAVANGLSAANRGPLLAPARPSQPNGTARPAPPFMPGPARGGAAAAPPPPGMDPNPFRQQQSLNLQEDMGSPPNPFRQHQRSGLGAGSGSGSAAARGTNWLAAPPGPAEAKEGQELTIEQQQDLLRQAKAAAAAARVSGSGSGAAAAADVRRRTTAADEALGRMPSLSGGVAAAVAAAADEVLYAGTAGTAFGSADAAAAGGGGGTHVDLFFSRRMIAAASGCVSGGGAGGSGAVRRTSGSGGAAAGSGAGASPPPPPLAPKQEASGEGLPLGPCIPAGAAARGGAGAALPLGPPPPPLQPPGDLDMDDAAEPPAPESATVSKGRSEAASPPLPEVAAAPDSAAAAAAAAAVIGSGSASFVKGGAEPSPDTEMADAPADAPAAAQAWNRGGSRDGANTSNSAATARAQSSGLPDASACLTGDADVTQNAPSRATGAAEGNAPSANGLSRSADRSGDCSAGGGGDGDGSAAPRLQRAVSREFAAVANLVGVGLQEALAKLAKTGHQESPPSK